MATLKQKLNELWQSKSKYDDLYSQLQKSFEKIIKKQLTSQELASEKLNITHLHNQLSMICKRHNQNITNIKYEMSRVKAIQNKSLTAQQMTLQSLEEFFKELYENTKKTYSSALEKIYEIEKVNLYSVNGKMSVDMEEQESLNISNRYAGEAVELAREAYNNLSYQESRLTIIKTKVADFIGDVNIGRTLTRIISNRSAQDYKLIIILTIILVVEILVSYYYIRPWIKGT